MQNFEEKCKKGQSPFGNNNISGKSLVFERIGLPHLGSATQGS